MFTEIKTGITSTKATLELIKTVKDITDRAHLESILFDIRNHLADVQEKLLETQQLAESVLKERTNFEDQLKQERNNNDLLGNYYLVEPRTGIFLYRYKPVENSKTPVHHICPNCFSNKTVSILQLSVATQAKINCPKCNFTYNPMTNDELDYAYQETINNIGVCEMS